MHVVGFSPDCWLNLQSHGDPEVTRRQSAPRIGREVVPREAAQQVTPTTEDLLICRLRICDSMPLNRATLPDLR